MKYSLKISIVFIIFLVYSSKLCGQFLSNIDVNSGGEETQIDKIVFSYSIGGFATATQETDENIVTQGYQQIDSIILQAINLDPEVTISAFPNPSKGKIFIMFSTLEKPIYCKIEVLTPNGRSTSLNDDYYFENEVPVEIDLRKNKHTLFWLKIFEKDTGNLLGVVKVVIL